jgi:photosystem II stability/assembly factor-like uncharacterized protein
VYRTEDGGTAWQSVGLAGQRVTSIAASPAQRDIIWAGTEPSEVWRSDDGGETWQQTSALEALPSSSEWSFPPRPDTHHVRWIACHPRDPARLWIAIEAGALVSTADGGHTWRDRVSERPYDTHELAIHPAAPEMLRVAAGDGYFESADGGASWSSPRNGLDVGYLRSVAVDPGDPQIVIVSASSSPRKAYQAGVSDGRLYRRVGQGNWERVLSGWPATPSTIAPLIVAGARPGEFWAADERGLHRSDDGGATWRVAAGHVRPPRYLTGLALIRS